MIAVNEKECRSDYKTSFSYSLYGLIWGILSDAVGSIVSGKWAEYISVVWATMNNIIMSSTLSAVDLVLTQLATHGKRCLLQIVRDSVQMIHWAKKERPAYKTYCLYWTCKLSSWVKWRYHFNYIQSVQYTVKQNNVPPGPRCYIKQHSWNKSLINIARQCNNERTTGTVMRERKFGYT